MNPRLVGCLGAAMLTGGSFAAATIYAGGGLALALLAYVGLGSLSLVLFAALAVEQTPRATYRAHRRGPVRIRA